LGPRDVERLRGFGEGAQAVAAVHGHLAEIGRMQSLLAMRWARRWSLSFIDQPWDRAPCAHPYPRMAPLQNVDAQCQRHHHGP
jgi:hypothetical protein